MSEVQPIFRFFRIRKQKWTQMDTQPSQTHKHIWCSKHHPAYQRLDMARAFFKVFAQSLWYYCNCGINNNKSIITDQRWFSNTDIGICLADLNNLNTRERQESIHKTQTKLLSSVCSVDKDSKAPGAKQPYSVQIKLHKLVTILRP